MKKAIILFSAMLIVASCAANRGKTTKQSLVTDTVSVVSGLWERGKPAAVKLYEVYKGRLRQIASSVPDTAGRFNFAFMPARAAFYVIGTSDMTAANNYTFWFKPGDDLDLTVTAESYVLTGDNTPENVEMTRWHDLILPLELKSVYFPRNISTFEEFFPILEAKLAEGYTSRYTADPVFNSAYDHYRESYMAFLAGNYLLTPHAKQPTVSDFTDYYRTLDIPALATSQMLDYPYGSLMLRQFPMLYMTLNRDKLSAEEQQKFRSRDSAIDVVASMLPDAEVRGEYMLDNAAGVKTYEGLLDFESRHSHFLANDDQRARLKQMIASKPIPKGSPAVDFRFPDINGKEVALSDFKGKVVYIDVWATWCGPCKGEIPYLKKLEAEYHDNPGIVFMSVSTDAEKDRQKWLDMVASEELSGVQLFGGGRSTTDLTAPYKIKSIPRFILVGKDGNIINDDAPRPSSSEIRPLLNAAIAR